MALDLNSYYIYRINTFNAFTGQENALYNGAKKRGIQAKLQREKELLEKSLSDITKHREVHRGVLFDKNGLVQEKNVVSIFESDLIRWILYNRPENLSIIVGKKKLLKGIIFLHIYHYDILKNIIQNGLLVDGKEYYLFTAGANQQKKSEVTLLEKSILNEFKDWHACGLTDEVINERGGMNTGKYLAYSNLPCSASKQIEIDIDKVIVVPDLKITLDKEVEYIDTETFESLITTLKELDKPINQTDGAGMLLPSALQKIKEQLGLNYDISGLQIRAPWMKGALFPFDFKRFCIEKRKHLVTDIYHVEHDVIAEDIQMILTASQFKAYKLYKGWDEYKRYFKTSNLHFCVANVSNPPKEVSELNYQFLQTLDRNKAAPLAISSLCAKSTDQLRALRNDKNAVLDAFGAVEENKSLKPLQEALLLYPALLGDKKVKNDLAKVIQKRKGNYKAGGILAEGFYGYAMPDMYGFCEFLFEGNANPLGLIPSDAVYCDHYRDRDISEVDCLRAPHLGNEHMIRRLHKSAECAEWFTHCGQNVIYSLQDYLMLGLQGDVDGDTIFITPERCVIDLVKPHTVLYYDMPKAEEQKITRDSLYKTLVSSFASNDNKTGNSIGNISNTITKIWNTNELTGKLVDLVKHLVVFSNFTIDYPKTQKALLLLREIRARYDEMRGGKLPYFFQWAKGTDKKKVYPPNESVMNLVTEHIAKVPDSKFTYFKDEAPFDYSMLQRRTEAGEVYGVNRASKEYIEVHNACVRLGFEIESVMREIDKIRLERQDALDFFDFDLKYAIITGNLLAICPDKAHLANILVDIHYNQVKIAGMHRLLWACVGDELVESIHKNLGRNDYTQRCRTRQAYIRIALEGEARKNLLEKQAVIYEHDIELVGSLTDKEEQKVYFAILCLCKRNDGHTICLIQNSKALNKTKLAKMAGLKTIRASSTGKTGGIKKKLIPMQNVGQILDSLETHGLIKIKAGKKKGLVLSLANYDFSKKETAPVLRVHYHSYPYVYYSYLFENRQLKQCAVCGVDFTVDGNTKTCGEKCSKILETRTKKLANLEHAKTSV